MNPINELATILKTQLPIDKRRLFCLAHFILALIQMRTVNLTSLALCICGHTQTQSAYRRLQRLLSNLTLNPLQIGCWLLSWFYDKHEPLFLSIDRTNWQFGKAKINFLVIAVPYKRVAIPLIWILLPKKGNSNTMERITLLTRLLKQIPKQRVKGLLADREFVGSDWFSWLLEHKIPFYIRVKHNYVTQTSTGRATTVSALFYDVPLGSKRSLDQPRRLLKHKLYLTGSRLMSGDLMVIATPSRETCAITAYLERWEIETLFQCLKCRGFDLEATHITDLGKLECLMSIVNIAACWAYRAGSLQIDQGKLIKIKKHGRPSYSLFRHGLDSIRKLTLSRKYNAFAWRPLLKLWKDLLSPRAQVDL